jgi:ribonuclease HI
MTSPLEEMDNKPWTLSVDGASNIRGNGAGVILEGPDGILIEQSLRFAFKASNNQAEYEALIAGMKLAKEMEVRNLRAKSDSQLVTNQVSGDYQTKDPQLIKYLEKVQGLAAQFEHFELIYVPREQNSRADLLSKLASTKKPGNNRTVIQETIAKPTAETVEILMVVEGSDWRYPLIRYLQEEILPEEKEQAARLKKASIHYAMIGDKLYKRGFAAPMLLCVGELESQRILREIHDGSCGNHIGGRSLAGKVIRAGFFWPTILSDAKGYVRGCDKCQRYAELHHSPGEPLKIVMSPWPFYM